jgi:alpha-tubulin suppressor-like RCC1 family protein
VLTGSRKGLTTCVVLLTTALALPTAMSAPASALGAAGVSSTIAAGLYHSLALKDDGSLWTFGSNVYGQLGRTTDLGAQEANPTPTQVMTGARSVAAGNGHSLVLKANGSLWTFGSNYFGELGRTIDGGSSVTDPTPTQVMTGVSAIAAGALHSLVLRSDGSLWTFGSNFFGQLGRTTGDPFGASDPTPTQVMTGVSAIAAGGTHSLALKTDGSLWSFGDDSYGQLGRTSNALTYIPNATPTQVMTGVSAMAAGATHSLALRTDGSLWTFGSNYFGELGTTTNAGTAISIATPTQVMTGVSAIAAGYGRSLALKGDGSLWRFGYNGSSQPPIPSYLGDDATPTQMMTGVTAIAAGGFHSLALKADRSLWSFGDNRFGQLGTTENVGIVAANPTPMQAMTGVMQPGSWSPPTGSYASLVPGRLLESRPGATTVDGQSQGIGLRAAGSVTELQVTGRHGVPADASAAVLNVTVTGAQADGFVTVWPCGTDKPNTSSLNFVAGQTIPNAVITKIGAGGKVCLSTTAATFLLADINGFYSAGSSYTSLVPGRLLESRPGATTIDGQSQGIGLRAAGSVTELQVTGRAGVPDDASAAVLNVTVTGAQADGFVTVWPCGTDKPNTSNLNYVAGQTIANAVITKIGVGGKVCLSTTVATFLLADITGFYPAGSTYTSLVPGRLLESRSGAVTIDGVSQGIGLRPAGSVTELQVTARHGVPEDATAAVLNVTVTGAQGDGFVTVWPCGTDKPNASSLNFVAGQTIPNAVITKIGAGGKVCLSTTAATFLLADVNGYESAG